MIFTYYDIYFWHEKKINNCVVLAINKNKSMQHKTGFVVQGHIEF